MINYVKIRHFKDNNCLDLIKLDDFENLINENDVKCIFIGKRTNPLDNNKGKCFLVNINSIFYAYTYESYGVYNNINDFKNARINGFIDAREYYLSRKINIDDYKIFWDYLSHNYNFSISIKETIERFCKTMHIEEQYYILGKKLIECGFEKEFLDKIIKVGNHYLKNIFILIDFIEDNKLEKEKDCLKKYFISFESRISKEKRYIVDDL